MYFGGALLFAIVLVGIPLFFSVYERPTCFDGVQNGRELGIDCGGACSNVCKAPPGSPVVLWQRMFQLTPNSYNAIAYVENKNLDVVARDVPYEFTLYDERGFVIAKRAGAKDLFSNRVTPIFEAGIRTEKGQPIRVSFRFTKEPVWQESVGVFPDIRISGKQLHDAAVRPRLEAYVKNHTLSAVYNLEIVALVFDLEGNAIAASRTDIDALLKDESKRMVFTWSDPFVDTVARIELYPSLNLPILR